MAHAASIAHHGRDELAHVAPIAHPGQICLGELSSIAQALKTCADDLPSYRSSRENMCSSCSSRSSPVIHPRKELASSSYSELICPRCEKFPPLPFSQTPINISQTPANIIPVNEPNTEHLRVPSTLVIPKYQTNQVPNS